MSAAEGKLMQASSKCYMIVFDLRTLYSVASCYTDYAISVHFYTE